MMGFMTGRLGDLDGTTTLLFVFIIVGAWTAMGWTTRLLGVGSWTKSRALFRTGLTLVFVAAVAWLMTGWISGVSVVVGAWTVMDWIGRLLRGLLRSVTHKAHLPRLFDGCAEVCPRRASSWADHCGTPNLSFRPQRQVGNFQPFSVAATSGPSSGNSSIGGFDARGCRWAEETAAKLCASGHALPE